MNNKRRTQCVFLSLLTLVMLVSLTGGSPVTAQSTTLSLSPVSTTALTCTDTLIAVRVENVTGLNAYDIWLEFTPGSIEVWEVTNGSFLTYGYYNLPVVVDNAAGTIHITMTQISPALPQSGSGDLIFIRLRARVPDATFGITFDDDLVNHRTEIFTGLGNPISFTKINGTYTTEDCEPAVLSLSTPPVTLCVGYPVDIYVKVDNVLDLYAYDLDLTFNPYAISISSVTNATFLTQGFATPGNGFNNTLGTVNFGMTQSLSETNLPRDGGGNLIKITLQATHPDQTVAMNIGNTSMLASWSDYNGAAAIEYTATAGTYVTAICNPTAVIFGDIDAQLEPDFSSVKVLWNTFSEINLTGFNVYRSESLLGTRQKLNTALLPAFNPINKGYSFVDDTVTSLHTYYYWIEAEKIDGERVEAGPIEIFTGARIFLPMIKH